MNRILRPELKVWSLVIAVMLICAVQVKRAEAASGLIGASSTFVYIPSNLGSTTITWSTSGCPLASVYVNVNNTDDKPMSAGPSGSVNIGWIVAGQSYVFKLYANADRTELLDSVTVVGIGPDSGNIAAFETEAIASVNGGNASVELAWGSNGYATSQVFVSVNKGPENLLAQSANGTSTPGWIVPGFRYDFKLYANTDHSVLLDTVTVYGRKAEYTVGACYHATGADFDTTSFLRDYHIASIRSTVRAQMQGMADRGASIINMHTFPVQTAGVAPAKWKWNFPPTEQQLANLRTFAQDVAAIQATDGHRLQLDIMVGWIWASDYQYGSLDTGIGMESLLPEEFTQKAVQSYEGIIDAVYDVCRPDGHKVTNVIHLQGEVQYDTRPNEDWFLLTHYPGFVQYCQSKGVKPSLYFSLGGTELELLNDDYIDPAYPILNGHSSMYWAYRSLKLIKDNNMYMPDRIDFSFYPGTTNSTYDVLITRAFDDADAVLPSLGCRKWYSVVETFYLQNNASREAMGKAFAKERLRNNRLSHLNIWTTPDSGGPNIHAGYPFEFEDYLP